MRQPKHWKIKIQLVSGAWNNQQAAHIITDRGLIDAQTISGKEQNKLFGAAIKIHINEVVLARAFRPSVRAIYFVKRRRVRHDSNETGVYALGVGLCNWPPVIMIPRAHILAALRFIINSLSTLVSLFILPYRPSARGNPLSWKICNSLINSNVIPMKMNRFRLLANIGRGFSERKGEAPV